MPSSAQAEASPGAWDDLNPEIAKDYVAIRKLPDGRFIGARRLMYHWTIHVGITEEGYDDRWCFHDGLATLHALALWDGQGDMCGPWHKHPSSGRRRHPPTGIIWDENQITPQAVLNYKDPC